MMTGNILGTSLDGTSSGGFSSNWGLGSRSMACMVGMNALEWKSLAELLYGEESKAKESFWVQLASFKTFNVTAPLKELWYWTIHVAEQHH